jgi:aryl-alcohol dehydrogenase-like predicted oxidoreductase
MQNQYSLTYREEEREMNAYCNFEGIGLIPWGPLNAGQLARPLSAESTKRADATKGTPFEQKVRLSSRFCVILGSSCSSSRRNGKTRSSAVSRRSRATKAGP